MLCGVGQSNVWCSGCETELEAATKLAHIRGLKSETVIHKELCSIRQLLGKVMPCRRTCPVLLIKPAVEEACTVQQVRVLVAVGPPNDIGT